MTQHSEETNELFNLMARQIKKRAEERINLYTVEDVGSKRSREQSREEPRILMDEQEMDQYILDNEDTTENEYKIVVGE